MPLPRHPSPTTARQIRAISFDGDMTLWDFENVMRSSLAHVLAELREHLPVSRCVDLTVDTMIEIRNTVAEEFKGKRVALEWIRLEALHADGVQHRYNAQPRIAAAQLTALEAFSGPRSPISVGG
jgi:phosphoglycolate phosphatase-like HAD superfamily hydrolase